MAGERGPKRRVVSATINKSTRLAAHPGIITLPCNDDPAKNTVFAMGMDVREVSFDTRMEPSAPILLDISRLILAEILVDDPHLQKVLIPEYLDYYSTDYYANRIFACARTGRIPSSIPEGRDMCHVLMTVRLIPLGQLSVAFGSLDFFVVVS